MLAVILISCLGILVYSNTFFSSFHYDDEPFIIQNPAIRNLFDLPHIWHYFHSRFIVFLSLAFNYHLDGLNVWGYHLFNLGVHLISSILVCWLVRLTLSTPAMKKDKITQDAGMISLLAGLVFVCHPVQIEAVTYIWQRAASMAAMFYLASICLYVKWSLVSENKPLPDRAGSPLQEFYYISALLAALLAMFTKENAVSLPLMILFYEFAFLKDKGGIDWKRISPFLATFLIIPVLMLFIRSQTFQDMHGDLRAEGGNITTVHYFLTQLRAMASYIRLVFLPVNQNIDYDYPIFKSLFEIPVLVSCLFLISLFCGAKCLFLRYRLLSFSIFWFFLTLILPESSFWAMGNSLMEHRLYLPMAGFSLLLVSGIYYILEKNKIRSNVNTGMVIILSLVIACYSILAYQRNSIWKDEFTLWNDAAFKSPHQVRPFVYRGRACDNQEKYTQAILDYERAIKLDPNDPVFYYDLGIVYEEQGKPTLALIEYTKAIIVDPSYVVAYVNRGSIYSHYRNFNKALEEYSEAIEIAPGFGPAYYNRYNLYYFLKEYDKAWADVRKAEELGCLVDPQFLSALRKASGRDK